MDPQNRVLRKNLWVDLEGPQIYNSSFILSRSVPKTQSAHEWAFELVSGSDFGRNLHFFEPEPFPDALGVRRGPQRAENLPKNKGRIYNLTLPEVCPENLNGLGGCQEALLKIGAPWLPPSRTSWADGWLCKGYWADLAGPEMCHLYLLYLCGRSKNTKYQRMGLIIGLRV